MRVISAQLFGSVAFDSLSPALLAIAIACQVINPWGLVLIPPFLLSVAYMRHMQGLAYRHTHREIESRAPRASSAASFLPVEFTELWFDIERTHDVMSTLLDMYRADENLAGTFTVELYAAKASRAWLSPSHGRDSFRVDIFWYQRNAGDPVLDYYPKFFRRLEPLAFRAHWGKYLPQPGSAQGAEYLTGQFPRWSEFSTLRQALDPKGTFLSVYWRRHLGID